MFRIIVTTTVALCFYFHLTSASPTSIMRHDDYGNDSQEGLILDSEPSQSRELGSVLLLIKSQFKEIIVDCALQALKYIKLAVHHYKVKLLKKLGTYTLSDIFHVVFDGVIDFVIDSSPEEYEVVEPKPIVPSYPYRHPYGQTSMYYSG